MCRMCKIINFNWFMYDLQYFTDFGLMLVFEETGCWLCLIFKNINCIVDSMLRWTLVQCMNELAIISFVFLLKIPNFKAINIWCLQVVFKWFDLTHYQHGYQNRWKSIVKWYNTYFKLALCCSIYILIIMMRFPKYYYAIEGKKIVDWKRITDAILFTI